MDKLMQLILPSDFLNNDEKEVLECALLVTQKLVEACGPMCEKYRHGLFKILLQLRVIPQMAPYQKRVDDSLEVLAEFTGAESLQELFNVECLVLLDKMKKDCKTWN